MKTKIHCSSYLAQFFLVWEMSHTKVVGKIKKKSISCSITIFFFENHAVLRKCIKIW